LRASSAARWAPSGEYGSEKNVRWGAGAGAVDVAVVIVFVGVIVVVRMIALGAAEFCDASEPGSAARSMS
jgi:hypothetical protein